MVVGDAPVMPIRDFARVAQPGGRDMRWEGVGQFGRPGCTKVLPEPRPLLKAGPTNVLPQLRGQIPAHGPESRSQIDRAWSNGIPRFFEERPEFGENRDHSRFPT